MQAAASPAAALGERGTPPGAAVIEKTANQYLSIATPAGQRVDITLQDGNDRLPERWGTAGIPAAVRQ